MDRLILGPLRKACKAASLAERTTWPRLLVIDGLDECSGPGAQQEILQVVSHLVRHMPFPLTIFLSCRPEPHIRGAFQGEYLSGASLKICLPDAYSSRDDLRKLFVGKFQEAVNTHSHILQFQQHWPGERVINQLIAKSSGQFIYASTVMKYIDVQDDNPMDRLDVVLGLEKSPDNENPFSELDALYRHILGSVKPKYLPIFIRMLQATLSQLEVGDRLLAGLDINLVSFLGLKPGEFEYTLRNLEGILVEPTKSVSTSALKFYHASFSDFLLDETRSGPYFIDVSLAHTEVIVNLFRYIINVNDTPNAEETPNSITTSYSRSRLVSMDDFGMSITVNKVIRLILFRLRSAALTEELRRMLHCVNKTATVQNLIRNCTTCTQGRFFTVVGFRCQLGVQGLFSWELMAEFATALGKLSFNDAAILQHNFRDEVKKFISRELQKYPQEPLRHLIALFMIDSPIPFSLTLDHRFRSFILTRFLIDVHVLQLDKMLLNLERSFWADPLEVAYDWSFLRQLIKEVNPNISYTTTCLRLLKCLTDLSPLVKSDAQEFQTLIYFVSSGLRDIEEFLVNREAGYHRPCTRSEVVLLWHVFCLFGAPLFEQARPSAELQRWFKENKRIIFLFSHTDRDECRRQKMWQSIKEAMDGYLLRCQSFSDAPSAHGLEETGSIPVLSSESSSRQPSIGMSVPSSSQTYIAPLASSFSASKSFGRFHHHSTPRQPRSQLESRESLQDPEAVVNPSRFLGLESQSMLLHHGKKKRERGGMSGNGTLGAEAGEGSTSRKRIKLN